jgi:negative regulator of sigma E activity
MQALFVLACSAALAAQAQTTQPDPREIARSSIAATERNWRTRVQYTYLERDETRRLGADGHTQSQDMSVSTIIHVNGIPFEQLTEHNGRPPSAEEKSKQAAKLDKLKRETPQERAARLRKEKQESASLTHDVLQAFDYRLIGTEVVNGRPAYVLQAAPRPGYRAESKYGKMIARVEGKIWVDQQDLSWVKADGQVIEPFSMGLFLARVLRGSHITMEQTRLPDGIWLPKQIEVRANAKLFFIKTLMIDRILSYSGYRQYTAGVTPGS